MPDANFCRLPSLNSLRAFAVVGEHLSLTAAARELFVTPSALSHQIRSLESMLGVRLFRRLRHGLVLTHDGEILLPGIRDAFIQIAATLELLKAQQGPGTLTISMLSTFAMRWFIPRLARFQQSHPDIEVRIATSIELANFNTDGVDCAIRSGHGDWPGTRSVRLFSEKLTPVCSPGLVSGGNPLNHPRDLARHTLLHAKLRPDDWQVWLHAVGQPGLAGAHEQTFETRNFVIAAALKGVGIAIVDPALVSEEIRSGRLIQPFPQTLPGENAYYLVYPDEYSGDTRIASLQGWLEQESAD